MAPAQGMETNSGRPAHFAKSLAAAYELLRRGELEHAEVACRNMLSQVNDDATLFELLGMVLIQKGEPESSIAYLEKAASLQPGGARMHNNLGIGYKRTGRLREAETAYRRATLVDGNYAQAHNNLGVVLVERGDYSNAVMSFRLAVNLDAEFVEARRNLARALLELAQFSEAATEFRRVLKTTPGDISTTLALASALRCLEDYDGASTKLNQILKTDPGNIDALFQKGLLLQEQGALSAARESLERIISVEPDHAGAHNLIGVVSQALGDLDEAVARFRRAISIQPYFAEAHRNLAMARRHEDIDDDVRRTQRLKDHDIDDASAMHAGFALAKIFDDLDKIDDAFAHLSHANRLKRRSIHYDVSQDRMFFESLKQTFDPTFFANRELWGKDDSAPIFIVGMPRSGTTLVEQIMASHPRVWGAGEILDLDRLLWAARGEDQTQDWCEAMVSLRQNDVEELATSYLRALKQGATGADRVTDKTPGNFHYIGMIRIMMPRAKIINCVRDPLDTCFSCYQNYFSRGVPFAYDLRELGTYYRLYSSLMDHWREALPGFVYDLRYEDLLQNQEAESRRLLDFCGLEWDPVCLDFYRTERPVQTASVVQVRRPIYRSSIGRATKFANHLMPLRDILGDVI